MLHGRRSMPAGTRLNRPLVDMNVPNVMVVCEVPVSPMLPVLGDARIPDLTFVRGGIRELMVEQRATR